MPEEQQQPDGMPPGRYVVLAPASSDQVTLLTVTAEDCRKQELSDCSELCQQFTTKEVPHSHLLGMHQKWWLSSWCSDLHLQAS